MSRFAKRGRVFFIEEPVFEDGAARWKSAVCGKTGVDVRTPVLPHGLTAPEIALAQAALLDQLLSKERIRDYVAWYYTPMALEFTSGITPRVTVYDCMDELTGFAGAPPSMGENERRLFRTADLVFTGGASLFAAKRKQHSAAYLFPSSVDSEHFANARVAVHEPADQAEIPNPRIGYAGVIDERMDLELIREIAARRPDWHIVMIGPVAKIDATSLPRGSNIHYLGLKPYSELPAYFSGWRVGMLPFALNDSTRFISPTKTPEYLAAGLRVVSTPIHDVVSPYGENGLAGIAENSAGFVETIGSLLSQETSEDFRQRVDGFLARSSWDRTWSEMNKLIAGLLSPVKPTAMHIKEAKTGGVAHV